MSSGDVKSKGTSIEEIIVNNTSFTSSQDIAETFNDYFSSIGDRIADSIQPHTQNPVTQRLRNESTFEFSLITPSIVESSIMGLKNKKGGLSCYTVGILKRLSALISPVLTRLINLSLINGSFPDFLKTASVIPIHKNGSKTEEKRIRKDKLQKKLC